MIINNRRDTYKIFLIVMFLIITATNVFGENKPGTSNVEDNEKKDKGKENQVLDLDACIEIALKNNQMMPASKQAIEIAEAQHKQALAAYWPQLSLSANYTTMDQAPNFIFPARTMSTPASSFTIPSNAFGPQFPPQDVEIPIPPSKINIPEQDVKLMDKDIGIGSLDLTYPLYLGGKRRAMVKQAESGIEIATQEMRRTNLKVIFDVKNYYYSAFMARKLLEIGRSTLKRMEVTLELTETLYKSGSGRVKKTDYLRNKIMVEGMKTLVASLKYNEELTKSALVNSMGLSWDSNITLAAGDLPYTPYNADLSKLVADAYEFNPDWATINAALKASEAKIGEARSGMLPQIALTGNLTHIMNSYDSGIVTSRNKNSWKAGISLNLPLFDGFLTGNKIKEASAKLSKLKHERILLKEGVALKVKHSFLKLQMAQEQVNAAGEAAKAATENRELNERAYADELVETKDVIEAQLMESFMNAQYQKVLYDYRSALAEIDFVVGNEVNKMLQNN